MKSNVIIIDAYNVIHSDNELRNLLEVDLKRAQEFFIHKVQQAYVGKKVYLYIVFDGRALSHRKKTNRLSIIYSKASQTADELIVKLVSQQKNKKGVTVVTSDNEIINNVRKFGSKTISSKNFLNKFTTKKSYSKQKEDVPPTLSEAEIQEWLNFFKEGKK